VVQTVSSIQGVGLVRGSDCQFDTECGFGTWFRLSVRYWVWVWYVVQTVSSIQGVTLNYCVVPS
jgi:hypothetical protein